ncbi:hypothetical protein R2601_03973 [Salipiger bermudensis HTCC2601]|uniref:Uncharacterized protein n=1 Tax=Salipiger bermudensis (strain DSM 26914 / JCM 13377 / KCTC 12554 / HTCC2601) TaxID=314265 RepID=Q0FW51_SALBH|nr:hypothetical protein R2601_03973 [Salipiger bermudensis HTCC2601]
MPVAAPCPFPSPEGSMPPRPVRRPGLRPGWRCPGTSEGGMP